MKKLWAVMGTWVPYVRITTPTTSGTALADARAANSAHRGGLGTITVKLRIQTATHDRPHGGAVSYPLTSRY